MLINAAVFEAKDQPFVVRSLQLAEPRDDELIVEILAVGICHTDIGIQAHHVTPSVLGHEGCGRVLTCGPGVSRVSEGDLVALTFGYCGACSNCQRDMPSHCNNMMALNFGGVRDDGQTTLQTTSAEPVYGSFFSQSSFASHGLVTERNAVRITPDTASPAILAPLGCGVQTGTGAVINTLAAQPGMGFVCFGVGAVGLSAIMGAKIAGCDPIIAIDVNNTRLQLAADLGASACVEAGSDVLSALRQRWPDGLDLALDTAGTVDTFHAAIACTRMGGHTGVVTVPNWMEGFHFKASDLALGRTVTGVLEGSSRPHEFLPQLYRWYTEGKLPVDKLIQTYAFEDINEALQDLDSGRAIKPVLML